MSVVEDLEKLKQLKDSGAITDTEFEIEKLRYILLYPPKLSLHVL